MLHILVCSTMDTACSTQDMATANGIAIGCARHWEDMIWHETGGRTRMMMTALKTIPMPPLSIVTYLINKGGVADGIERCKSIPAQLSSEHWMIA